MDKLNSVEMMLIYVIYLTAFVQTSIHSIAHAVYPLQSHYKYYYGFDYESRYCVRYQIFALNYYHLMYDMMSLEWN